MCNQREKLIGYLYDECETGERVAVQEHLESCADCRAEIASLRSVREDLTAWEVPAHESVWRPFAPAAAPAWWQQLPRWAFAAAASVVLVSGAVGGAATHAFMPHDTAGVPGPQAQLALAQPAAEIVTLQKQIAALREELSSVKTQKTSETGDSATADTAWRKAFDKQLANIRADTAFQANLIEGIYSNQSRIKFGLDTKYSGLASRVDNLQQLVLQQSR